MTIYVLRCLGCVILAVGFTILFSWMGQTISEGLGIRSAQYILFFIGLICGTALAINLWPKLPKN